MFNTCLHKNRRRLCRLKVAVTGGGADEIRVASGVAGDAKNLSHVLAVWAGKTDGEVLAVMLDKICTCDTSIGHMRKNNRAIQELSQWACLIGSTSLSPANMS